MEPSKSPSAPPKEWNSAMGQPAPPRYQEYPQDASPAHYAPGQTVQPMFVSAGPLAEPVKDYMRYSIFTMLCCCLPLGVAALVNSIAARDANLQGNQASAEKSSKMAKKLNHAALGVGVAVLVLWIASSIILAAVDESGSD